MKYENVKCPVCNEVFTEESDVVVCPKCGTPHHRECYNEKGKCGNSEKHAEGFAWVSPNAPMSIENKTEHKEPPKVLTGGVVTPQDAPNGAMPAIEIDRDGNTRPVYRAISGNEKIGEFTVEEYGKVVQKNIHKYIPNFLIFEKTDRKISVNWAAFLFGPFWLFYRKMYKYGFLSLLIIGFLPIIFMGDVMEYTNDYTAVYTEFAEIMLSDADMSDDELNAMTDEAMEKVPVQPTALSISNYLDMAISIALGLFGNLLYKMHCEKILVAAKPKRERPEEWEAALKKAGGRSILSVVLGYVTFTVAVMAVSAVYTATGNDVATLLRGLING